MKKSEFFSNPRSDEFTAIMITGGWVLSCSGSNTLLETSRDKIRTFKSIDTISKLCQENGVLSFDVKFEFEVVKNER